MREKYINNFERSKSENPQNINTIIWLGIMATIFVKSEIVLISLFGVSVDILLVGTMSFFPILFLVSISFCFPPRGSVIYLVSLNAFISILFIADMVYSRAFGHLLSLTMAFAGDAIQGIENSVISLIRFSDIFMIIDLPLWFYLIFKVKKRKLITKRLILFGFTCFISILFIFMGFKWIQGNNLLTQRSLNPLIMSPIGYHMYDLYHICYDRNVTLSSHELDEINNWISSNKKYLSPSEKYKSLEGVLQGKNIITIQWESLENFVIDFSFEGQEITPYLNEILEHSIYFDNIVEQVQDGNSSDAELIFNTSLYPIDTGSAFIRFGANDYNSLPKLLKQKRYTSIAVHGDSRDFWNRDQVFPNLGFDRYVDESMFIDQAQMGMGITDESLIKQILYETTTLQQPYNIYAITLTSHMPFDAFEKDNKLKFQYNDITTNYLKSINYTDSALGSLYEQLSSLDNWENTVLVIYGDHEGLHKYYETEVAENNNRVPFIVYIPGLQGFRVNNIGGQVDMMPTLAFLLGIESTKYSDTVMGRNLLGEYSGSGILPTGLILKGTKDTEHLSVANRISDMMIKSNYFTLQNANEINN